MNTSGWMAGHRKSILFLLVVLIVAGGASSIRMPASLFPAIDFPRVRVDLDAGDRPADRMGMEVTWPVEEAVRSVPGVRTIRSTTSRGSAEISINFDWGQDMQAAALQVQSAISQIAGTMPQGTTFEVHRMDPTVFPVLAYSLISDVRSSVDLRDTALYETPPPPVDGPRCRDGHGPGRGYGGVSCHCRSAETGVLQYVHRRRVENPLRRECDRGCRQAGRSLQALPRRFRHAPGHPRRHRQDSSEVGRKWRGDARRHRHDQQRRRAAMDAGHLRRS